MDIKGIGIGSNPYCIADFEIICEDKIVVHFQDLGIQLIGDNLSQQLSPLFDDEDIKQFAKGSIAKCFGEKYRIYDNRQAPRTPNGDLQLVTRIVDIDGERFNYKKVSTLTSEYDVPADAWYYNDNSFPSLMPYSVLMEIALQPCGFLSAYIGSSFIFPDIDFYFRNLDGNGELLKQIDLKGKTIRNDVKLLSTSSTANTIIQSFTYSLSCDNEEFYKGSAVFGYFAKNALTNQAGLDGGKSNDPKTTNEFLNEESCTKINLREKDTFNLFFTNSDKKHYKLGKNHFELLDEVWLERQGGKNEMGYIYAYKNINIEDWYFSCHFYGDPVMPGSLGIEAMYQAIQTYLIHFKIGSEFSNPRFNYNKNKTSWKYRGQIVPSNNSMKLEVHIKSIDKHNNRINILADSSIWKDKIRIYEVKDISVSIIESY